VVFEKLEEVNAAYDSGRCDVYTTDQSGLYSIRLGLSAPDDHVVLPEIISKEPLGPLVRHGDDQWFDIVKWVHNALIISEEFGITQANVEEMKNSDNPEIKRVLGMEPNSKFGADLGLGEDWVVNVVTAVGNYGEIFERNIGQGSPLKIAAASRPCGRRAASSTRRRSADCLMNGRRARAARALRLRQREPRWPPPIRP